MNIESITEYLVEEGFRPQLDEDGDIRFKHEGKFYYIQTGDSDEEFVRILAPNIWPLDDAREKKVALRLANKATRSFKVAKVVVSTNNNVCVSLELFVLDMQTFTALFYRCIGLIDDAVKEFRTDMRKKMKALNAGSQQDTQETPAVINAPDPEGGVIAES